MSKVTKMSIYFTQGFSNYLDNSEWIKTFFQKNFPCYLPPMAEGGESGGPLTLGNTQIPSPGHQGSRFSHSQPEISDYKNVIFSRPSVSLLLIFFLNLSIHFVFDSMHILE